jgi:predicted nucleic acid-binding protein
LKLLVDTNVWVDHFMKNRAGSAAATALLEFAAAHGVTLLYPIGSIKDVYYLLRAGYKALAREICGHIDDDAARAAEGAAWDCVRTMRDVATAVGADESDLWLAERNHALHRDLEDDLVIAAAQRSGADYLVTVDRELRLRAPVAALAPEDMLIVLETAFPPQVGTGAP